MRIRIDVLALALCACSHQGAGQGELQKPVETGGEKPAGEVSFTWTSGADPGQGNINATFPDGRQFQGTFLQLTSTTLEPAYAPYYAAWSGPGWGTVGPWYTGSPDQFVTQYSGKLMAHLSGPDGARMRCEFIARQPEDGLAGGAQGDCQLSTNETVFNAQIR